MKATYSFGKGAFFILLAATIGSPAQAADPSVVASALRLAGTITGGTLSTSTPEFSQMVNSIQGGDYYGAAMIAAKSQYFAEYLARRLAKQMQVPTLDASGITDSDATLFLVANMIGAGGVNPNISAWWSNNYTCLVNVNGTPTHIIDAVKANAAFFQQTDLRSAITCTPGQTDAQGTAIPQKHVGGYVTLSDRAGDTSFAQFGATAGTNLRYIEGIWEISMGMALADFESTDALLQEVPKFVPSNDPSFNHGQGQPACISCHAGGLSSLNHGYATVADVFNFDPQNGFTYLGGTTGTFPLAKSLGSDPNKRNATKACTDPTKTACNQFSAGVDPNQSWDVNATWASSGLLARMGFPAGQTTGQGLNALGSAIGKATLVYQNLVNRVMGEVCPLGTFSNSELGAIAVAAEKADDIRSIVASIASHPSCR